MTNYTFNPQEFGFIPIDAIPVLRNYFGPSSYVKVTSSFDRNDGVRCFWYTICHKRTGIKDDDRWEFHSGAHDPANAVDEFCNRHHHTIYCGCIASRAFAKQLLIHLFGTMTNGGTLKEGKLRLTAPSLPSEKP